jgi:hypothetical protein
MAFVGEYPQNKGETFIQKALKRQKEKVRYTICLNGCGL